MLASAKASQLPQKYKDPTDVVSPAFCRRHFPLVVAYKSPYSLDFRPSTHSSPPSFLEPKIIAHKDMCPLSPKRTSSAIMPRWSLLQHTLHIHLFLDQNIEAYETCVCFLQKYAPPKQHVPLFRRPPTQNQPQKSGKERDGSPLPSEKDTLTTYAFVSLDSFSILPST